MRRSNPKVKYIYIDTINNSSILFIIYLFSIRVDDSDLMDEMTTKMAANNIKKNSFKPTNSSIDKSVNT